MPIQHRIAAALAVAALSATAVPARADLFEQGPVTRRDYRNQAMAAANAHPVETENLFGFTLGSDIDAPGTMGVAAESVGAYGRRDGTYRANTAKLEFSLAPVRNLSVSVSLLGGAWTIADSPDLANTRTARFRGIGGELRLRLLERELHGIGLTLHVEPSMTLADEVTGEAGTGYASENKLIADAMLVPDRLWAAVNLTYDLEQFRPWNGSAAERGAVGGIGGALTARVGNTVFLGAEMRYLMAFQRLSLNQQLGSALYAGPTGYWRISDAAWLAAAWNIQLAGHANNDPNRLDLTNFSRQLVRLKLGFEF